MKAIITFRRPRIAPRPLVERRPKCLIDFNGRTLLDRQLDTLEAEGVHEAVVVTGFHERPRRRGDRRPRRGPTVRTIYNPFYKVADNLGSLFIAKHELCGDCLV